MSLMFARRKALAAGVFAASLLAAPLAGADGLLLQMVGKQQRLSQALVSLGATQLPFPAGLIWQRADLINDQSAERHALLGMLREKMPASGGLPRRQALIDWLAQQPVTGREFVPEADPRYLEARPDLDPVLGAYDQLGWSGVPRSVAVLGENGAPCAVSYQPNAPIRAYLQACLPGVVLREILLVSPDGHVTPVPVADWSARTEPVILPGSWIWLPLPGIRSDDQLLLARQVGTLGPYMGPAPASAEATASAPDTAADPAAPDASGTAAPVAATSVVLLPDASAQPLQNLPVSSSDWGGVGLLQTPSARMRETGSVAVTVNHAQPYTRLNVMLQPLNWLEAGFRYTDISNRDYGAQALSGSQTYKDKSIDAKVRLLEEGESQPELSLGMRDVAGTGLFSGEYVVTSKRWEQWDFSLGLGWGYVGARGDIGSPLGFLADSFRDRERPQAGESNTGDWFKGPMSFFGGAEWHSLNLPVSLKLEYDGNDYSNEPLDNRFGTAFPLNFGVTWRVADGIELQAALERGDTLSLGLTFYTNLSRQGIEKTSDPAPVALNPERPATGSQTDWAKVAGAIEAQTGSHVEEIRVNANEVRLRLGEPDGYYLRPKAEEIARVLHNEAPASADWFALGFETAGLATQDVAVNRDALVQRANEWQPADRRTAVMSTEEPVRPMPAGQVVFQQEPEKLQTTIGFDFDQILGGPDSFVLFNLDAIGSARYNFTDNTWLSGIASARLFDNFDDFRYTAASGLPRVRTFQREYLTDSPVNLRNLQMTHTMQPASDQYVMLYGGLLERMFAGFGGEWMYRPFGSAVAVGVDVNRVQQRDFDQGFGLRDYRVTTGHVTFYWDTGFQDILGVVKVGRYLAGDNGITFDFSRIFRNGVTMGAYATFTDVTAAEYGEGRFTKGIYVYLPFDTVLNKSTRGVASFGWSPLTRDGGAVLDREFSLYGLTDARHPRALGMTPAR